MKRVHPLVLIALVPGLVGVAVPLFAQGFAAQHGEQNQARRQLLDGDAMPFRIIKRRVEQRMGDDFTYVGMAPAPRDGVYRMQFLRKDGMVTWVDVDSKSGEIVARTK